MNKRAEKLRRRQRKQERKFKQEGRRLSRREEDRKKEEEMLAKMSPQERTRYKAKKLAEQFGIEFDV